MTREEATGNSTPSELTDRPSWGRSVLLGLQHVLVMYAGVVVVPMVVGAALGLTDEAISTLVCVDLVLAGIGTIVQALGLWKFGIRMPLVVGAASNGIVPMILVGQTQGLATVYGPCW